MFERKNKNRRRRFKKICTDKPAVGFQEFDVYYDTETGVEYVINSSGFGSTMLMLRDKDGKPLIYNQEEG